MFRKTMFAAVALLAAGSAALAQADKTDDAKKPKEDVKPLTVGDPARPIDISDWLKGDKVAKFEPGKVYVLEFWATWCGPCRMSMPHITSLQQQYKDYGVTFIGVSDEKVETVKDFLPKKDKDGKTWDEKIGYTLTTDPDKSVYRDYFEAAGQHGIPTAFIIGKDQHIEWIGHPMEIEKPLEGVVKDSWDRAAFKAKWDKAQAAERESMKTQTALRDALRAKDFDKALSILDEQIAKSEDALGPQMQKFQILVRDMDQPDKAYALGEQIAKKNWDEPQLLNSIAWTVVDMPGIKTRNFDFALKLANRAVELTKEKDAATLDTLAHVYHDKGDLKKAVEIETKAVAVAEPGQMGDDIKATLEKYQVELNK